MTEPQTANLDDLPNLTLSTASDSQPATTQQRIVSAFAGALMVSLIVTPFDVVKSQMQSQVGSASVDGMIKVYKLEGYRGLWKGLIPTIIGHIPSSVIYYVGYDYLKEYLHEPLHNINMEKSVMSPLELLRTRIQASSQTSNRHIYNSIRVLVQENGWKSLWRGLSSTLWRDVPFSAIYWFSYEHTFAFMKTHEWVSSDFLNSFSSGCVCGSLAAVLTHPFDLLKTIQQISVNTGKDHSKAISMSRVVRKVVRDEGYFGLYRGLGPRLLKVAPACGIMITTYEIGKNYFQSGI